MASSRVSSLAAPTTLSGAPFGLKSQFWVTEAGAIRTARAAADVASLDSRVDASRLSALICGTSPLRADASLFEGVHRVPAASQVRVDPSRGAEIIPDRRVVDALDMAPIEASDALWQLVLDSVARLVGDHRKIGILTGGGVDSGALLAAAVATCRGASDKEVSAIALDFAGDGDDRPYLRELERALGIEAMRVPATAAAVDMRALLDQPRMPIWAPGAAGDLSLLRRASASGIDLVLTGAGGDDLFDGYPRLLAEDVAHGDPGAALLAARLMVPWQSSAIDRLSEFVVRPLVARMIPAATEHARRRRFHRARWSWAGPSLLAFIDAESARWSRARVSTPSERYAYLANAQHLVDAVEMCDELAKIADLQIAHPYLDEGLLALTAALPPRMLLHGDRLRGLFRLAIRGKVPNRLRLREDKAAFANARRAMLRAAGGVSAVADLAAMTECAKIGLVDRTAFQTAFSSFESDITNDDTTWTFLWPALAIEGFLRARASLRAA